MEGQSELSELSVISWMSAIQGCPLSGVPLYHKIATCSRVNDSNVGEACDVVELFEPDTLVCDSLDLRETCMFS